MNILDSSDEKPNRGAEQFSEAVLQLPGGDLLNEISKRSNSCHIDQLPVRRDNRPLPYCKTRWALRFNFRVDSSWPAAKGRSFP